MPRWKKDGPLVGVLDLAEQVDAHRQFAVAPALVAIGLGDHGDDRRFARLQRQELADGYPEAVGPL
jgi:hypothetical protein